MDKTKKNKKLKASFQLHQGDCLAKLKTFPDNLFDLVVMDPPYLLNTTGGGGCFGNKKRKFLKEISTMADGFDFKVLEEIERVSKALNLYIYCNEKLLDELKAYYKSKNIRTETLIWHKTNPVPACNNKYLPDIEFILFVRAKGVKVHGSYKTKSKVFSSPVNIKDKKKYNHPTPKPVPQLETLIHNSSQPGDLVLDCFMGCGSTGEASLNQGRRFVGIELDPGHFQTAENRLKEVAKRK